MTAVATRSRELEALRRDAADCRRCDLYRHATQTVFGEGRPDAPLMLVGEQPGDVEDEEGRPFVGPAGLLLREILDGDRRRRAAALRHQRRQALQVEAQGGAADPRQAELGRDPGVRPLAPARARARAAEARRLPGRDGDAGAARPRGPGDRAAGPRVGGARARGACPRHYPSFGSPTRGRAAAGDARPAACPT